MLVKILSQLHHCISICMYKCIWRQLDSCVLLFNEENRCKNMSFTDISCLHFLFVKLKNELVKQQTRGLHTSRLFFPPSSHQHHQHPLQFLLDSTLHISNVGLGLISTFWCLTAQFHHPCIVATELKVYITFHNTPKRCCYTAVIDGIQKYRY